MSIFKKNSGITRPELRKILRKTSPFVPGSGRKMYSRRERIGMEKKIFPSKRFHSHISEREAIKRFRELRKEGYATKTQVEKTKIGRQLRFLKGVTGIKRY